MNLDEPFEYLPKVNVILQKIQDTLPFVHLPEGIEKLQRLNRYVEENKVLIIDPAEKSLLVHNRKTILEMYHMLLERIKSNDQYLEVFGNKLENLKMTKYLTLINEGDKDSLVNQYEEKAGQIELNYPVIVKILPSSRVKDAHTFFVCHNRIGLKDSLEYPGYQNQELIF